MCTFTEFHILVLLFSTLSTIQDISLHRPIMNNFFRENSVKLAFGAMAVGLVTTGVLWAKVKANTNSDFKIEFSTFHPLHPIQVANFYVFLTLGEPF